MVCVRVQPGDHAKIDRENTWFWRWKHPKLGTRENCCHPNPISFHNYKRDPLKFFQKLDAQFNVAEGVDDKKFVVPQKPSWFVHADIPFKVDAWNNIENPPRGQRIYKGPGKERVCWKCDGF